MAEVVAKETGKKAVTWRATALLAAAPIRLPNYFRPLFPRRRRLRLRRGRFHLEEPISSSPAAPSLPPSFPLAQAHSTLLRYFWKRSSKQIGLILDVTYLTPPNAHT